MIEYVFAREIQAHQINVEYRPLKTFPVFVTAYPWGGHLMSVQRNLHGVQLLEAVALQMGRIVLGHPFQRSAYHDAKRDRKEWRQAEAWAALRLIPDRCMMLARRLGQDPCDVARDVGISERLVIVRYNTWPERRGQIIHLPPPLDRLDGAMASDPCAFF